MYHNILFIDIETAPQYQNYEALPPLGKDAFARKFRKELAAGANIETLYKDNASLLAEYCVIICMSVGVITVKNQAHIVSLGGTEKEIFDGFVALMDGMKAKNPGVEIVLCAHFGKGFDYPIMGRRMLLGGYPIPGILQTSGKKPWELHQLLDTSEMWQFGDIKTYISLIGLCYAFGVESPKDDIDGSKVAEAYYAGRIKDIMKYCDGDVFALMNVFLSLKGLGKIGLRGA